MDAERNGTPTGSTREYEFISNEKRARKKERDTQFSKNVDTNEICRPSANKNESMKCQDISSAHTSVALRPNRECLDIHCVANCSKTGRLCCNNVRHEYIRPITTICAVAVHRTLDARQLLYSKFERFSILFQPQTNSFVSFYRLIHSMCSHSFE